MITDTNMTPPEVREASVKAFREELAKIQNVGADENTTENNQELSNEDQANDDSSEHERDDSLDNTDADTQKDDIDDTDDVDSTGHMIPKGRFNKVIQQKKSLERELEEAKAERIRAQAELDLYNKAMEKYIGITKNNESKIEDQFEPLDTEAHHFYLKQQKQLEQQIESLKQQTAQSQVRQILENQEMEFTKEKPDFRKALDYFIDAQIKANSVLYDSVEEARQATMQQVSNTAQNLVYKGKNVAKTFYDMAKNFGYNPQGNSGPNIDAINQNMQKSKVANVNTAPVKPAGNSSNLTRIEEFEKHYNPRDSKSFYKILQELRKGK